LAGKSLEVFRDFVSLGETWQRLPMVSVLFLSQPLFIVLEAYFHVALPFSQDDLLAAFRTLLLFLALCFVFLNVLLVNGLSRVVQFHFHVGVECLVFKHFEILFVFFGHVIILIFNLLFYLVYFAGHFLFLIVDSCIEVFMFIIEINGLNDNEVMPIDAIVFDFDFIWLSKFLFIFLFLFLVFFPLIFLITRLKDFLFAFC
jgi:hypothetical protein